jgi:hypothetical protein
VARAREFDGQALGPAAAQRGHRWRRRPQRASPEDHGPERVLRRAARGARRRRRDAGRGALALLRGAGREPFSPADNIGRPTRWQGEVRAGVPRLKKAASADRTARSGERNGDQFPRQLPLGRMRRSHGSGHLYVKWGPYWRDFCLAVEQRGGTPVRVGAEAATVDECFEAILGGRGMASPGDGTRAARWWRISSPSPFARRWRDTFQTRPRPRWRSRIDAAPGGTEPTSPQASGPGPRATLGCLLLRA